MVGIVVVGGGVVVVVVVVVVGGGVVVVVVVEVVVVDGVVGGFVDVVVDRVVVILIGAVVVVVGISGESDVNGLCCHCFAGLVLSSKKVCGVDENGRVVDVFRGLLVVATFLFRSLITLPYTFFILFTIAVTALVSSRVGSDGKISLLSSSVQFCFFAPGSWKKPLFRF